MSTFDYVAQWPILDDGLRLSDLVPEAIEDLAAFMRRDATRSVGIARWWPSEVAGTPFLNVRVPAEPMEGT